MKKITLMIAAAIMFAACNGGSTQSTTTDSTTTDSTIVIDSAVTAVDSTVAQIPADSTK
jgi:ABC-type glycerol-3-phosphate transport system substrate-binding protein